MGGYTTALITYSHCICWFDSHNRDERCLSIACGTSVLLKFRNLRELEKHTYV